MPTVTVLHFGILRETRGTAHEVVEVAEGTRLVDLHAQLFGKGATLPVAMARNAERVAPETVVADGDEVVFLPPVGGG